MGTDDEENSVPLQEMAQVVDEVPRGPNKQECVVPETKESSWSWVYRFVQDWLYTNVIGFLVVSYWRGTWVLLDIWTCGQPSNASLLAGDSFCFAAVESESEVRFQSAWQTYLIGSILLIIGFVMVWRGWWKSTTVPLRKSVLRILIVYILGFATVNTWHGIWYLLDRWFLSDVGPVTNFGWSAGLGALVCYALCSGASLLAPPAIFLVDGPEKYSPPLANTIVNSYRSISLPAGKAKNDEDPFWLMGLDMFFSFIILPWGVVAFWRGFWYLMDESLWGFTDSVEDVRMSILWSYLIGLGFLFLGSEDVVMHIPTEIPTNPTSGKAMNFLAGRFRTVILAVGVVNFWRAVWLLWDEYLGKTSVLSAGLSHAIGVILLLCFGCLSCITAPPSTLGVDAVAHPDCADEPLFHDVPIPAEALYFFGIGRSPLTVAIHENFDEVASDEIQLIAPRPSFMRQSAAGLEPANRSSSISASSLSKRHLLKRQKNQFFRNR
ncbi:unnamed protein product [Cylindrotheca closterium]|uniref:Transmembrane protein n=1 Tax=Cylindrotheca closterium TaxID=2856 RepID=A0AAD2JLE3_9STRA|nr:unnamed protein product [Cylindrotheca closterium]